MSIKGRLFGAIVDGAGLSAGRDLYDKAKQKLAEELGEEPADPALAAVVDKERARAAAKAEKERLAEEKRLDKERLAAERARLAEAARREKQVEQELVALKKKLGR
jgi:hypothetical protein